MTNWLKVRPPVYLRALPILAWLALLFTAGWGMGSRSAYAVCNSSDHNFGGLWSSSCHGGCGFPDECEQDICQWDTRCGGIYPGYIHFCVGYGYCGFFPGCFDDCNP